MKSNNNHTAAPKDQREVLVVEGIQKMYGNRRALKGLTFTLLAGRVMGFLGPNGAGKTTSIRILTTIMEPDAGHLRWTGSNLISRKKSVARSECCQKTLDSRAK